ncbi:MAG: hypothetical protein AAGL08_13845 [Cyanobacteria bacterium J06573_11]
MLSLALGLTQPDIYWNIWEKSGKLRSRTPTRTKPAQTTAQ